MNLNHASCTRHNPPPYIITLYKIIRLDVWCPVFNDHCAIDHGPKSTEAENPNW